MSKNLPSMEHLFAALADRTRLRLLNLMAEREVCVCYFVGILRAPQPTISRHLAYLRRSGLVAARREGKWMHYRLAAPEDRMACQTLKHVLAWLAEDREMQQDRTQLNRACCAGTKLANLADAPTPKSVGKLAVGRS